MNPLQRKTAEAIVNVFETGRARGRYGAVTVLKGDSGHLSYGRSQAALGSGSLYLLLKAYCDAPGGRFVEQFTPLLPRFRDKDISLDFNAEVRDLLQQAGDDPVMQKAQDDYFDRNYWKPAALDCTNCGLTRPLSMAVVYDSHIHGHFDLIRRRVEGGPSVSPACDEDHWIAGYLEKRKAWLLSCAAPLPNTIYRVTSFQDMIGSHWDLELPLRVRGVVIDEAVLGFTDDDGAEPARVPDPASTRRILQLSTPYLRGDDVKALQTALAQRGFSGDTDGVFGPMTAVLVKQFQAKQGMLADGVVGPATWKALDVGGGAAAAA